MSITRCPRAVASVPGRNGSGPLDGQPAGNSRLRVFVCGSCLTAEVVPWCGQALDCEHAECADALERCAAPHRLDERRFHGPVSFIIIERHLWDRYGETSDEARRP